MTGTGVPLRYVGSYCHCFTHSTAASMSNGWPEMTRICSTVPCAVSVASRTTNPLTRALAASGGYTGGTILMTCGSFTTPPIRIEGILVQKMLHGVEVMIGVTEDSSFGPLIAFGLGGIHVEVLADVCFRVTPLTDEDVEEMIRQIRGYRLLEGYRGHPPADIDAIKSVLLRVSRMVEDIP